MKMTYTTQAQVRAAFRAQHPDLNYVRINGDYSTDTRCAFVDFVDSLARNNDISDALAQRVTL